MDGVRSLQEQMARAVDLTAIGRMQSEITSALDAAGVTSSHFESAAARITREAQRINEMLTPSLPALRSSMLIFEQLAAPAGVLGIDSTLAAAMKSLRQAAELSSLDATTAFLQQFEEGVREALDEAPEDPQLRLAWYGYLLSIFLFVLGVVHERALYQKSANADAEFQSRVMKQLADLNDRLDQLQLPSEAEERYEFYLVDRQAPLTQKPRRHSTVVRWLQPGELVWVRQRLGVWVRIQYVDSLDATVQEGWVKKKYLTR
jgi:hypothetical protein